MIPLHFGSSATPLYGVHHPATERRKRKAVLILSPWGWEALRAHRTLKMLADRLAAAGYDTLRFDYSCSGDSSGAHEDARFGAWLGDAETAMEEVMAASSARRVSVYGLRMGGLIAALLAGRRPQDVDRVVLWESPTSGDEFLRWIREASSAEVSSFPVPPAFRSEVAGVQLGPALSGFRGHVLAISERPLRLGETAARSFSWIEPSQEMPPCWLEDLDHGAGTVPVPLLDRIVAEVR